MTKHLLFICSLFLLVTDLAGQSIAEKPARYFGLTSGYRNFLVREELESFRNFSGGSIPAGLFYLREKQGTVFEVQASAVRAMLDNDNSAMEMDIFVSNVDLAYMWDLAVEKWNNTTLYGGVKLVNQASARTYFFNSPIGGQNPFSGEFISAPGAVARFTRAITRRSSISWKIGWSPMAYLISRDFHPIRGFQTFGDVPKGIVFSGSFSDVDSELNYSLALGDQWWLATGYRWRYLYYKRSYSYQLANHELMIRLSFKPGK